MPHPPALLLRRKINSLPSGLLNWSTSFCRFVMVIVPSRRKKPYLTCPSGTIGESNTVSVLLAAAELLKEVERLSVIADKDNLVRRESVDVVQEPKKAMV
jgi:hypothetical protein